MNYNGIPELLFASQDCTAACVYHTQMVTWNPERGRFINLLGGAITSDQVPTVQDIDNDQVSELIIRFDNSGDAQTGPLRTGYTVYDWNGIGYVQSVTQLNPPRFRIQVIQEADAAFAAAEHGRRHLPLQSRARQRVAGKLVQRRRRRRSMPMRSIGCCWLTPSPKSDQQLDTQQTIQTRPIPIRPPRRLTRRWRSISGMRCKITNNLHSACLQGAGDDPHAA